MSRTTILLTLFFSIATIFPCYAGESETFKLTLSDGTYWTVYRIHCPQTNKDQYISTLWKLKLVIGKEESVPTVCLVEKHYTREKFLEIKANSNAKQINQSEV